MVVVFTSLQMYIYDNAFFMKRLNCLLQAAFVAALSLIVVSGARGQIITTIAGNGFGAGVFAGGGYSGDGGPATAAKLSSPIGITTDAAGNIYFAEQFNHVIRKVDVHGVITTIAGTGAYGFSGDGGPATAALLKEPLFPVCDGAGNIIFSDGGNRRIRKISTAGIITTIAGCDSSHLTGDGNPATAMVLSGPSGIALDKHGNILFADGVVNKITPSGLLYRFAGCDACSTYRDGAPATLVALNVQGIAFDTVGNLYLADQVKKVLIVDTNGIISTFAGRVTAGYAGDGGPAIDAELSSPFSVAVDHYGNVLIGDYGNNVIRVVNTSGIISTIAGSDSLGYTGDGGPATDARLYGTGGMAFDPDNNLLFCDITNNVVRKVTTGALNAPVLAAPAITLNLLPNPNDGHFWMRATGCDPGDFNVVIVNAMGQVVKRLSVPIIKSGIVEFPIHLNVAAGKYFLFTEQGGQRVSASVVVQ